MAQLPEAQFHIDQQRKAAAAHYPQLFAEITAQWNSPGSDDRAWLLYSANTLFRTAGIHAWMPSIRWAIDPLTLNWRVPETPAVELRHSFDQLDFALLTHIHPDHLDFDLLRALRHLPIRWVIPEFILPQVQAEAALPADQIRVPHPLQPLDIHGIHILPFAGQHWEESPAGSRILQGVPATGYLVEFNGKRWLFPGDTRTYRSSLLPALGPVDGIFAHLWLGRGCALMDEPPLLDEFCQFCLDLQPERVVLAHLQDFGREPGDFWEDRHARQVISRWEQLAPQIPISAFHTGECVIMNSNTPPARAQTTAGRARAGRRGGRGWLRRRNVR